LLAHKIWEDDTNARGGLLGRTVKLVYYDDQTNPAAVPGIYAKLLDVDKVDLIIGGYGTNMLAPAMPVVIHRNKLLVGLFGLAVNSEFNYPKYFSMVPNGPQPKLALTKGLFDTAMAQNSKPTTVAIVGRGTGLMPHSAHSRGVIRRRNHICENPASETRRMVFLRSIKIDCAFFRFGPMDGQDDHWHRAQ
jgi:hypothetical protein